MCHFVDSGRWSSI